MRVCWRVIAVAFISFATGSGPLVADETERHEPDVDMFASMTGIHTEPSLPASLRNVRRPSPTKRSSTPCCSCPASISVLISSVDARMRGSKVTIASRIALARSLMSNDDAACPESAGSQQDEERDDEQAFERGHGSRPLYL